MYTIESNSKYELIVKNSKFITILYKLDNSNITPILNKLKEDYPNATHYTYAYIFDNLKKASDDGEPSGTAGIPILKVLESQKLSNVLCVVIRYFGGIKLGANGLIRAYTKACANAIKENNLKELIDGYNLKISFSYEQIKEIDYLLTNIKINEKKYDNTIIYNIDIPKSFLETIKIHQIDYQIIKDIKLEK